MDKKFKKSLKIDVPSMVIGLSFGVLGVVGNPWMALPGAVVGASSLRDMAIKKDEKDLVKENFKKSFWGFYGNEINK